MPIECGRSCATSADLRRIVKSNAAALGISGPVMRLSAADRIVVPKGKTDWLAYVNEFVEEAKASAAVQQFIERGGTPGVTVAPLGNSN